LEGRLSGEGPLGSVAQGHNGNNHRGTEGTEEPQLQGLQVGFLCALCASVVIAVGPRVTESKDAFWKLTAKADPMRILFVPLLAFASLSSAQAPAPANRPLTFLDLQHMRQVASPTPSPDGKWRLHAVSTPDWKEA